MVLNDNRKQWVSMNEYARINKLGYVVVKKMCSENIVKNFRTEGGQYKIYIGNDNFDELTDARRTITELEVKIETIKKYIATL